jgi:hypothetical protein
MYYGFTSDTVYDGAKGMIRFRPALNVYFFVLFPVLSLFSHNVGELRVIDVLLPTAVVFVFGMTFWFLTALIIKDRDKSSAVTSVVSFFFYSYGLVFWPLHDWAPTYFKRQYFVSFWVIVLGVILYFLLRTRRQLQGLTRFLNIAGAVVVAVSLLNITVYKVADALRGHNSAAEAQTMEGYAGQNAPDIYYIILDRYASNASLREFYGYDNSEFTNALKARGFYVAEQSFANYLKTLQSLTSSLNMTYLDEAATLPALASDIYFIDMVRNHRVGQLLKTHGYRYIHVGSWYHPTFRNRYADENWIFPSGPYGIPMSEFTIVLLENTMLSPLRIIAENRGPEHVYWERTKWVFDKLEAGPDSAKPVLLFAHIPGPHPPYVFGKDGEYVPPSLAEERSEKDNYINQLIYMNKLTLHLMDTILAKSKTPPIIVLQGDEGPYFARIKMRFRFEEATDAELRQKYGILNAYFFPDEKALGRLYPSITPVNSFRLIFDTYFDGQFELLEDKIYMQPSLSQGNVFIKITDRLRSSKNDTSEGVLRSHTAEK